MIHKTSPTNPKGYAVEPFDLAGPEEHGRPLDAVSRDAEPVEDDSGADANMADEIARECGLERGEVSEVIHALADRGMIGATRKSFNGSQASVGMETFARLLVESPNPKLDIRLIFYALNSAALDDVLGHHCPADFARKCDCTRANATKRLEQIQKEFGLPPRKGQRDDKAKQKFSEKQKEIYAKAPKKKIKL